MRVAALTPLRHPQFRLLFAGQVVSDLGDWLDLLALMSLLVYRWQLGPSALAALTIAVGLPRIVVGPFAGVLVDRWPRRTVLVVCDLARAAVVLGLFWAPNLAVVLGLLVLKSVGSTFFSPARQAAIASVVPREDLFAASSLSQLSQQISKVLGPILGGLLLGLIGPRFAFVADACTFVLSAAFLVRLPPLRPTPHAEERAAEPEQRGFWEEFRAGLAYTFQQRTLALAVVSMSATLFIIFAFDSLGVLALKLLGVSEGLVGLALACVGCGTVAGAMLISQWGKRFNPFALMGSGQLLGGVAVALLGGVVAAQVQNIGPGAVVFYLALGLSAAAIFVPYGFVLQSETPREMMGRVFTSADSIQTAFQLAAPLLGAALAEIWGLGAVFLVFGGALALLGLVVLLLRPPLQSQTEPVSAPLESSPT